jgi:hypothetical protein
MPGTPESDRLVPAEWHISVANPRRRSKRREVRIWEAGLVRRFRPNQALSGSWLARYRLRMRLTAADCFRAALRFYLYEQP